MPVSIRWVCTKCGRSTARSTKPDHKWTGKCPKSSSGLHNWVKD